MQWLELEQQALSRGMCCRYRQLNRGVTARLAINKELPYNTRKLPPYEEDYDDYQSDIDNDGDDVDDSDKRE